MKRFIIIACILMIEGVSFSYLSRAEIVRGDARRDGNPVMHKEKWSPARRIFTEKGTREMATNKLDMTGRFIAIALKNDPSILAQASAIMDEPAANDASYDDADWQQLLANDPAYIEWIEGLAEEEEYRHARW